MKQNMPISPQYLQPRRIEVTINKIVNPSHFILRETPGQNMSREANQFLDLEQKLRSYYNAVKFIYSSVPEKGTVVVVLLDRENKWCRAKVDSILESTSGLWFRVYLLDYGEIISVRREGLRNISPQFLVVPFQAIDFVLLGLEPKSMIIDIVGSVSFGQVSEWDSSAFKYVTDLWKRMLKAEIEVQGYDDDGKLYGSLYILDYCSFHSLNDVLTENDYACVTDDPYNGVHRIESYGNFSSSSNDSVQNQLDGTWHGKSSNSTKNGVAKTEMKKELFQAEIVAMRKSLQLKMQNDESYPHNRTSIPQAPKQHHSKRFERFMRALSSASNNSEMRNTSACSYASAHLTQKSSANANVFNSDSAVCSGVLDLCHQSLAHTDISRSCFISSTIPIEGNSVAHCTSFSSDEKKGEEESSFSNSSCSLPSFSTDEDDAISDDIRSRFVRGENLSNHLSVCDNSVLAHTSNAKSYDENNVINTQRTCQLTATQVNQNEKLINLRLKPFDKVKRFLEHSACSNINYCSMTDHCIQEKSDDINSITCKDFDRNLKPSLVIAKESIDSKNASIKPEISSQCSLPTSSTSCSLLAGKTDSQRFNQLVIKSFKTGKMTGKEQHNESNKGNCTQSSINFTTQDSSSSSSTKPANMTFEVENNGQYFYKAHCTRLQSFENPSSSVSDLYSLGTACSVSSESNCAHSRCNQTVVTPSKQRACIPSSRKTFEKVRNLCQSGLISRNSSQAGCLPSHSFIERHTISDGKDHIDDITASSIVAPATDNQIIKAVHSSTRIKQLEERNSKIEAQPLIFSSTRPANMALKNNGQCFYNANLSVENPSPSVNTLYSLEATSSVPAVDTNRIHSRCNQAVAIPSDQRAYTPSSRKSFEKIRNVCQRNLISRNSSRAGCSPPPSFTVSHATSDGKDHVDDLVAPSIVAPSTDNKVVEAINNTSPKQHKQESSGIEMQPSKCVNILKTEVFLTDDPKKNHVADSSSITKLPPENHGVTLENNTHSKEPIIKSQQNFTKKNANKIVQSTSDKNTHSGGNSSNTGNTFKSQPMVQRLDYSEFNINQNLTDLCFQTNVDFSGQMLWEDVELPVIKLGQCIPKPMCHTDEAPFTLSIKQKLEKLRFWGPSCIQSVVWPAVFRNRCFVAIAPAGSGKTIAYLLPLLSNLIDGSKYQELPVSKGPILLVLCSTWMKVQRIYNQCQLLLGDHKQIKIITLYKGGGDESKMDHFRKGCDILISTPTSFLHYLEQKTTNFERCCHMILDDGDVLIADFKNELTSLMDQFQTYMKIGQSHPTFQIALCAQKWTKGVASFAETFLPNPLFYFTNFLEAAVCAQVPTYVLMTESSKKDAALLSLMDGMKCQKLVICTSNEENALRAHRALQRNAISSQVAHEKMRNYEIIAVRRHWESPHDPSYAYVLVVSDNVLFSLKIKDADCIIHYDLPATSRLQFGHRLGCFSNHFSSKDTLRLKECLNHIIITENCQNQAPTFARLLKRMNLHVPRLLLEMAAAQEQAKRDNAGAPLCPYLKAFGTCSEKHCLNRHMVTKDLDQPTVIPFQGDVKVQICHVMNATRYYGRVLEYLDPITESTVSLYDQYLKTCQAVKDYFQIKENRIQATSILKNNVYAVEETGSIFHRVQVIEVLPELDDHRQQLVKVLHLDGGWVKVYLAEKLYELSPELKSFPQTAAEIQLCNTKTLDMCNHWTPQANMLVCNLIENKVVHGKIALCLSETLWLNPVVIRETLSNNTFVNTMVLDRTLKEAGYAQDNPDHLISLFNVCAGKVAKPLVIETKLKDPSPETAHAFLDLGEEEYVQVVNVESPQRFFVQRSKFTSCLDTLLNDIATMKKNFELKHVQKPQKDLYCIAPFPEDERLYRARIVDFKENGRGEVENQLFYPDFGDIAAKVLLSEIYAMPEKLLLLPFQSIECELAGVAPLHGGWSEQAIDAFQDFTRNEDNQMKYLRVMPYLKSPCYSGGYHYVVQLYDGNQSLSEHIVVKGLALATDMPVLPQTPKVTIPTNEEDVPSGYVTASDDEMLPEEKDAAAMMCGILAGLLAPHESLKKKIIPLKPNSSSENTTVFHPQETTISGTEVPPTSVDLQLSESLKPQITWWDTLDQVVVSLKLFDVEIYSLDCFPKGFLFRTKLGDKVYCAEETLFDEVIREQTKVKCLGQSVELFFKKKECTRWPRLISSHQKVFHIKRDLEHIDDSDNELFHPPLVRDSISKEDIRYECSSDDSKSSEDDGDDYQSWQNICRRK